MDGVLATDPRLAAFSAPAATTAAKRLDASARARAQAQDFESMFLSTVFQSMFTAIEGEGPMGATSGVAPWRSLLTQEYAKSFAQKGGIGLADSVYRELLAKQEMAARPPSVQGIE